MEMMNDENALPRSTDYRCGTCCARPGEEHAADCTEANIACAAIIASDMLAELDPAKVPLAVPAAIGVLRAAINAGPAASRRAAGIPREPTQAMKDAAYRYREQMYAQEPPQPPTITGYWYAMWDAATPAAASAGKAAPALPRELTDPEIVEVLASLGTDAEKSAYDRNPVLQVRTTVPAIRQIVAAYLKRADAIDLPSAQDGGEA